MPQGSEGSNPFFRTIAFLLNHHSEAGDLARAAGTVVLFCLAPVAGMFQPKVIGVLVAAGIAIQRPEWFLALSAILCWNALFPALNPFDALYNATIARRRGRPV